MADEERRRVGDLPDAGGDPGLLGLLVGLAETFGYPAVVVLRADGQRLEAVASHGSPGPALAGDHSPRDDGVIGEAYRSARPVRSNDLHRTCLAVPMRLEDRVWGVLAVESGDSAVFADRDVALLSLLADQLARTSESLRLRRLADERAEPAEREAQLARGGMAAAQRPVARSTGIDQLRSRFLAIASHELRTPLTVVMGFAEVLAEHAGTLPVEQSREYAEAIARQARSLSHVVEQMLLAAQIDQGGIQVQPTACELLAVVARALRGGRGQHVEVLPGTDVELLADPFRLQQVLEALLDNAIKYAKDAGRIQLDARTLGATVEILIRDEGPGIPRAEREAVFDVFHQVGEHGIAGRRGIGLGLAIARDLLRLMDGDLALATAEGYGATFLLRLPAPPR